MFEKLVAIEPISLVDWAEKKLNSFAKEVVMFEDIPQDADEIVNRIGDADAVLLSYTTTLDKEILKRCPNIKYIGMCCSLYSPESANVDINYAKTRDIVVTGIRDYGDEGVVEYVVSELVRCLHGFETSPDGTKIAPWNGVAEEITGLKCGIIGLGKLGGMIADALSFFGATIDYVARSEKEDAAKKGYKFVPINDLMANNDVVICCLNKNTVLLHEREFESFGNHKILFNVGLSRAWDEKPFIQWLSRNNRVYCDSPGALGNEELQSHPNVRFMNVSAGRTRQAFDRLSEKVIENLSEYNG
ncbi:MAG TPA: NAD(P)-dependent oxidoreductase [Gelidibacter sp.]|uniref:NAD(P)-dependent oxidoreductase n=1 Tax=Gelidibacter sp. TaxID=2018083 RepID=UPI002C2FAC8B|nr:NAD(P)-dependent oxidoreductase [Gelidibacter sp.]HXJ98234.1 NAD(P)-dependent oxidoreductase [Gelidibacter sp.]